MSIQFAFYRYTPKGLYLGRDAALMGVFVNGEQSFTWMSKDDLEVNVEMFGEHPALMQALQAREYYFKKKAEAVALGLPLKDDVCFAGLHHFDYDSFANIECSDGVINSQAALSSFGDKSPIKR